MSVCCETVECLRAFVLRKMRTRRKAKFFEERRELQRDELIVNAEVQPLDADLNVVGPSLPAVTRNISTKGIGFVHADEIVSQYVAIRLDEPVARSDELIAELVWTAHDGPFLDSGARLIRKR